MFKITRAKFLLLIIFFLAGCSSESLIVINNSLPKAKLILQKDPDEKSFYSATYESVSQSIYNDNVEILLLKDGENKFKLDQQAKDYAAYFILPSTTQTDVSDTWKYIINPNSKNDFSISAKGTIEKISDK